MKEYFKQLFENMRKSEEDGAFEKGYNGYGFYVMDEHFFLFLFFEICFALSAFLLMWLYEGELGEFTFVIALTLSVILVLQILRNLMLKIIRIKIKSFKRRGFLDDFFYGLLAGTITFSTLTIFISGEIVMALILKIFF